MPFLISSMQQEIIKVPFLKTNFETEKKLSAFEIFQDTIVKFIRSLDQNKARDYDSRVEIMGYFNI